MHLSIHSRSLLRGMVAGVVALAGASACSRSDRAAAGRDTAQTGAVVPADTQASASTQPTTATQPTTSTQPSSVDTATGTPPAGNRNASSDTVKAGHRTRRARSTGARVSSASNGDQGVAGYKAMGSDTSTASANVTYSAQVSTAAPPPTDTSSSAAVNDTTNAGSAPMARDTSVALAQGDTATQSQVETSSQAQADTATIGDTAVILSRADTTKTEVAMNHESDTAAADTAVVANDSAAAERIHADTVSQKADELAKHESARVRPPEDSTADAAAVGAAGVASTGNIATGADAVAQMSSQGERCSVAASDEHRDVLWDMASSPATLNPCGTGTMTLPRIWTGEKK